MIVEYIRYKIDTNRQAAFLESYTKAMEQLDASEYCLAYELTHCEEKPEYFILRIEWTSTYDHLNGFRKSPLFAKFLNHVRPFYNDIEEMNHYQLTSIIKRKN